MKRIFTFLILLFVTATAFAQFNKQADSLLKNKQYFLLNDYVKANNKQLEKPGKLYYDAFLHNFFNKPQSSNSSIQSLLKTYSAELSVKQRIELLQLEIDNDLKTYQYKAAYTHSVSLLKAYRNDMEKKETDDIENSIIIWKSLQQTPPQMVTLATNTRIPYKRDLAKLMTVPVNFGSYHDEYVFDTGANISVITESNAIKANILLKDDYFEVDAITGIKLKARTGVAPELKIGDIVVKNVVFLVFPDSALSFANGAYKIQGILGFPVIEQFKEVRISMKGYIDVPAKTTPMDIQNFGLDGLTPVINVKYLGDMLPFTFDTGAQMTLLNKAFYERYKTDIEKNGKPAELKLGGAGGNNTIKSFTVPEFAFHLYDKSINLKGLNAKTTAVSEKENYYYGNMGQDVLRQFDELVLNFEYMYAKLTSK